MKMLSIRSLRRPEPLAFPGLRAVAPAVAALALFAMPAIGDQPDPRDTSLRPMERLEALLERVRTEQKAIETLESRFVQRKESVFLSAPAVSSGTFSYAAPDSVRWEYERPDPISLLVTGDEMVTWFHDLEQVERMHVGRHSQRVLEYLGAGSSIDSLLQYFTVSLEVPADPAEPYRLALEPRFDRVAKRLAGMSVWIDSQLYLPVRLRLAEGDGDVTEYEFSDFAVNRGLPDDRFVLDLPPNATVRTISAEQQSGAR